MDDVITTAPMLDLKQEDLAAVLGELENYHQIYRPLFQRREQRENAALYLRGLLSRLERKSVEPMVLQLVGGWTATRCGVCNVSSAWERGKTQES